MTATEPKVSMSGRYSVTEASRHLGVHRNTLRSWTEQGIIRCGFRKITARKFYLGSEIIRVWKSTM